MTQMFEDPGSYIAPYLTEQATADVRNWRARGKAVFQRICGVREVAECQNCSDVRYVYLSFCKAGPFPSAPSTKAVVTFFNGDSMNGKGYYIVKNTVAYPCPHCEQEVAMPA